MLFPLRAQRPKPDRANPHFRPGGWQGEAARLRRLRYLESLRSRLQARIDRINDAIALEVGAWDDPERVLQEDDVADRFDPRQRNFR